MVLAIGWYFFFLLFLFSFLSRIWIAIRDMRRAKAVKHMGLERKSMVGIAISSAEKGSGQ